MDPRLRLISLRVLYDAPASSCGVMAMILFYTRSGGRGEPLVGVEKRQALGKSTDDCVRNDPDSTDRLRRALDCSPNCMLVVEPGSFAPASKTAFHHPGQAATPWRSQLRRQRSWVRPRDRFNETLVAATSSLRPRQRAWFLYLLSLHRRRQPAATSWACHTAFVLCSRHLLTLEL